MKKIILSAFVGLLAIMACKKSSTSDYTADCSTTKSYSTDVSPIIQSYCATSGCHASGSRNGPGALTTYQQVYNYRSDIRSAVASGTMPENTTLSSVQKNAIICWIDNGASNN